jgi:DNA repair photolyase
MITPFYGEFLISPVPLELSLNACSHGCYFCFSLLNQHDRHVSVTPIMNLLKNYMTRHSLEASLLRAGYPVLISNRVDPFANSNYQMSVPILRTMTELGIPIAFQTRGGRGIDEALEFLQPSVWYISINTQTDTFRKQLEPGAPDMDSRFRLMETLRAKGHSVVLGLNPVVEEWLPDPEQVIERAKNSGAQGAWVETLHFNPQ